MKRYIRATQLDLKPEQIVNKLGEYLADHLIGVYGHTRSMSEYKLLCRFSKQLTGLDKNSDMFVSIVTYKDSIRINIINNDEYEATIYHGTVAINKFNKDFKGTAKATLDKLENAILKFYGI